MIDPSSAPYPVVLQVLPALGGGGVERGTVEISQAISEAGGTPLVASAGGLHAPSVERAGGRNIILPAMPSKNPWRIWRNGARLEQVIRENRVDLVHARSRAPAWSAYWATRRTGTPFVTTYHGAYNENVPGKRAYNAVMAKGDLVIAISRFIAGLIVERHQVDPARIRLIPRGVDPAIFDPDRVSPDRIMKLSRAWRLVDGQPVVLLPGRITRWKGQSVLIEALARMATRDVCVVLVGADQGRSRFVAELSALADRLGVASRVRMVGHCADMPAALKLASVVVNASTDPEAFGRVVIEAQSMGCPVIGTDHGGAVETIAHDVTGWRVAPGNADHLAAALDYALNLTDAERQAVGQAARSAVIEHFTTRRMQLATMAVYQELLG
jgi:glycosyltransferase involved in cell wall biosynthesis